MNRPIFREPQFRKALRSDGTPPDCVHVARGLGWVVVRDTKNTFGAVDDYQFGFRAADFDAFLKAIRAAGLRDANIPAGALDGGCIVIDRAGDNVNILRSVVEQPGLPDGAVLTFMDGEIAAFLDGVHNGEFDTDTAYAAHDENCAAFCAEPDHVALVPA